MRLYRDLLLLLVVVTTTLANAAPVNDLEHAASGGDASAVTVALKAGANVNARFDIGRTALMIAARHGHVAAVEALLDAGADMYAPDNNREDALMHAVAYEQLAVVRTLLNRGFDPSLNDWRALNMLPTDQYGDRINSKQLEIRKILLVYKEKNGPAPRPVPQR